MKMSQSRDIVCHPYLPNFGRGFAWPEIMQPQVNFDFD
jgi:hypothetical protein